MLLLDDSLKRLWGHDLLLGAVTEKDLRELTGGGVPTLREALHAAGDRRLMIDLPGATAESVRAVVGVVHESGAGRARVLLRGHLRHGGRTRRDPAPRSP